MDIVVELVHAPR